MGSIYLRKYGVATTVDFCLYELDGTDLVTNAASATGDIDLIRDEGAEEQLDADAFVDEGIVYSLNLSAAEMTAARITVYIIDQSNPKIWLDKVLLIETYGHASAQHPFDLATATQNVNVASTSDIDFSATQKTSLDTIGDTVITNGKATIADSVWDEVITAAAHNVADSGALYLRNIYQTIVARIAQAQAGAPGTITLDIAASAVNDYYKGQVIAICGGTGAGQARACYAYNGGTFVASIRPNWATQPDATSWYAIINVGSSVVAAIEDIDFGATMKASLNAATPNVTVSDKTGFSLSAAGIDSIVDEVMEGTLTLRQAIRLMTSMMAGKSNGGGTATLVYQDYGDTKPRLTFTADADGNRTAVVADPT